MSAPPFMESGTIIDRMRHHTSRHFAPSHAASFCHDAMVGEGG